MTAKLNSLCMKIGLIGSCELEMRENLILASVITEEEKGRHGDLFVHVPNIFVYFLDTI
jgi:hypothetical protein